MLKKSIHFIFRSNSNFFSFSFLLIIFSLFLQTGFAQTTDSSLLSLERIFASNEFVPKRVGGFKWFKDGNSYIKLESSATVKGAVDLINYDAETNKRTILVSAEKLIPKGTTEQLLIEGLDWSEDTKQILIYTKSERVWRQNTRGDYWVLDTTSGKLTKLGGDAKPSTLMFAKFSPDGKRIGYVHENDLYIENLADGKITRLTFDGSHNLINGTADWVNEEEFSLRDCWRWSPDGKYIAFWQFDTSGIEDFILVNNTTGLYPSLTVFLIRKPELKILLFGLV